MKAFIGWCSRHLIEKIIKSRIFIQNFDFWNFYAMSHGCRVRHKIDVVSDTQTLFFEMYFSPHWNHFLKNIILWNVYKLPKDNVDICIGTKCSVTSQTFALMYNYWKTLVQMMKSPTRFLYA